MEPIVALAERLGAPVITTFKAKGADPRRPPAGRAACSAAAARRSRSWLMNEADLLVVFGASFTNHTGIYAGPSDHPGRPRSAAARQVPPGDRAGVGATSASPRRALADGLGATARSTSATRSRSAGRCGAAEKASRGADDRGRGVNSAAVFDALTRRAPAGRGARRRRRQQRLLASGATSSAPRQAVLMSRLPRLDRLRLPGRDRRLGGHAAARARSCAVTGDGGFAQYMAELLTAVKHGMDITHVLAEQRPAGQDLQGAARGRLGRLADLAAQPRLLRATPSSAARSASASPPPTQLDDALDRGFAHPGPALVEVMTDPDLV